jgi:dTMP kinase
MRTLQLLFSADRAHHLNKEIVRYLDKGINVISDRYLLSTLSFGALELNLDWLKQINANFPEPDLTFILNVPGRLCAERIAKNRFGFEIFETSEKLERIRQNYLKLKFYHKNTRVIKGYDRSIEEIHKEIISVVGEYCKEHGIKI